MFVEFVTAARSEIELVDERTGLFSDPPAGLPAAVSWESGEDQVTTVMVWDSPGARGDYAFQKMMPLIEQGGITGQPEIVKPFRVFIRSDPE